MMFGIKVVLEFAVEAAFKRPAAKPVEDLDHRLPSSNSLMFCHSKPVQGDIDRPVAILGDPAD